MASTRVIGLDIGTSAVRAAEVEFGSGGPARSQPTLLHFGQVPLPPGAVRDGEVVEQTIVSAALRELWAKGKFSGKDVVLGVGNQRVLVRDLQLPWMPAAQVREALPFQVQDMLPMATTDALLDYFATGEGEGETGRVLQGMLVAAQRDTVVPNILAVEGAGLRPVMVDLNAFALLRSVVRGELATRTVALVDIGARITNVVVAANGMPQLARMLPLGGQNVTDAVAAAAGVSAQDAEALKRHVGVGFAPQAGYEAVAQAIDGTAQAIIEAIRNTFVYYGANHPGAGIDVVALTGGGSHLPGLGQYISSSTRLPVTLGDGLAGFKFGSGLDRSALTGQESLVALPVGLAFGVAA